MREFHVQKVVRMMDRDPLQGTWGAGCMLHNQAKKSERFFQDVSVGKRRAKGSRVGFLASWSRAVFKVEPGSEFRFLRV